MARRLDSEVSGLRDFLLLEQHRQAKRPDEHQNDNGAQGPGDFQRRVMGKMARLWVGAAVETQDAIQHQPPHEQHNDRDDHQDEIIKAL